MEKIFEIVDLENVYLGYADEDVVDGLERGFQELVSDESFWRVAGIKIYGFKAIEKCPLVMEILFKVRRGEGENYVVGSDLKKVVFNFLRFLKEVKKECVQIFDKVKWEVEGDFLMIHHETVEDGVYKKESIVLKRI